MVITTKSTWFTLSNNINLDDNAWDGIQNY